MLVIEISAELVEQSFRTDSCHKAVKVTKGIPDDAKLVGAKTNPMGNLELYFKHDGPETELSDKRISIETIEDCFNGLFGVFDRVEERFLGDSSGQLYVFSNSEMATEQARVSEDQIYGKLRKGVYHKGVRFDRPVVVEKGIRGRRIAKYK